MGDYHNYNVTIKEPFASPNCNNVRLLTCYLIFFPINGKPFFYLLFEVAYILKGTGIFTQNGTVSTIALPLHS